MITHPRVAAMTLILGLALTFLINEQIARIIGVPLIFVGILLGVAAIATPEFLESDRSTPDPESAPDRTEP